MTLQQFIEKWNGQYLEVAGPTAVNQCVDLANAYIRDVLGLPMIEWTNAKDFPAKGGNLYTYVQNTPTGVPQEGDLVIWDGEYGHIAIFIEGDANSFRSFDQNYPTGTPCHVQNHTYANVLGWLHAKAPEPMAVITQKELDAIRLARDQHYNDLQAAKTTIDNLNQIINDKNRKIDDVTSEVSSLSSQVTSCVTRLNSALEQAKRVPTLEAQIAECDTMRSTWIEQESSYKRTISQLKNTSYKTVPVKTLLKEVMRRLGEKATGR